MQQQNLLKYGQEYYTQQEQSRYDESSNPWFTKYQSKRIRTVSVRQTIWVVTLVERCMGKREVGLDGSVPPPKLRQMTGGGGGGSTFAIYSHQGTAF